MIMSNLNQPNILNSYDLLKAFAVITMVIDHIGAYLWLDHEMLRAIGRLSFPVWLFLIGYARSREIGPMLIAGALFIIVIDALLGRDIFPLNILVSILLVRLCLDFVTQKIFVNAAIFWSAMGLLFFAEPVTNMVTEYGSMAIVLAVFGYMTRRSQDGQDLGINMNAMLVFALLSYAFWTQVNFGFSPANMGVMMMGLIVVVGFLPLFRPQDFENLTTMMPEIVARLLKFCGHRTLEIYVIHFVYFKIAYAIIYIF